MSNQDFSKQLATYLSENNCLTCELICETTNVINDFLTKHKLDVVEEDTCICWATEDICYLAKQLGYSLKEEEAKEILTEVIYKHNASYGITIDVIDEFIVKYKSK
jgi:hypothetical protein